VQSILSKVKLGTETGGRPPAAVEISPEGVLAAALTGSGEAAFAFEALPAGALLPGIGEPNLRAPELISNAMRNVLAQVSPRTRAVTVVVPDTVVRVFVLDFDSLPSKAAEVFPVLRFRLRKMVPFDVEHAGLSYQILAESKTECRVLTAVLPGAILAEYEGAARGAGYEPGAVLPSSLAALAAVETQEPVLAANLSRVALTTSITNGQDLLLYRTLDLPEDPGLHQEEVRRGIAVAAAYFEDKLGVRPRRLHYAGIGTAQEFASWMDDPELTVVDLAARPQIGAITALGDTSIAGLAGALAGAR
jgi:type IV pilus assembly protein PilM